MAGDIFFQLHRSPCTCGVVTHYEADRDKERLHQFLLGVDDDWYEVVRSNLLSGQPLPTLNEAYSTFVQDENSKTIAHKKEEPNSFHAFVLPSDRALSRYECSKFSCTHCRQTGHDNSSCFKLHRYPSWWEERRQGTSRPQPGPVAPAGRGPGGAPQ
ncbi:hypothetical protein LIER_23374 [Lithospermum erythrorhizon]|uniref:Uncharacterized protein n=1 Tax=Lithospermum erythrorhizon TaxID=34254 RepID=A0AAV3QYR2_LITER